MSAHELTVLILKKNISYYYKYIVVGKQHNAELDSLKKYVYLRNFALHKYLTVDPKPLTRVNL